jgi:hypothetical protein
MALFFTPSLRPQCLSVYCRITCRCMEQLASGPTFPPRFNAVASWAASTVLQQTHHTRTHTTHTPTGSCPPPPPRSPCPRTLSLSHTHSWLFFGLPPLQTFTHTYRHTYSFQYDMLRYYLSVSSPPLRELRVKEVRVCA